MSQTLTAPLESSRPARRGLNLPIPIVVAAIVLAAAHMPLLVAHLHVLSVKPHYEFYPLVFVGAAVLAWPAWDSAKAWAGPKPNRRSEYLIWLTGICAVLWMLPSWFSDYGLPESLGQIFLVAAVVGRAAWDLARAAVSPSPEGRTIGLILLGFNVVLLTTSVVIDSPWLAMVSFWELLAATAYLAGGWPLFRTALPALIFLLLVIPPPLNLDGKIVVGLQGTTSQISSRLLDRIGVLHFRDGNAFEIGSKPYLVDKACSGINSLFSTVAVTLFCVLFFGAHWLRAILLFVAVVFWVVVANVIRVSSIVWLDNRFGIDLANDHWDWAKDTVFEKLPGPHSIFGFVLFGLVLAMMYSTNQFLRFLGTTVRWGEAAAVQADEPRPVWDPAPARPVRWGVVAPALAVYGVLLLFQLGEMHLGAAVTESSLVKDYNKWTADDLPAQISGWVRDKDSAFESRDRDNPFGAHSRTWQYRSKSGLKAVVSFDYPFPEWHDLRYCYKSIGWSLPNSEQFVAKDAPVPLDCVKFDLEKQFERGYGWFTEFDQTGKPIPVHVPDLTRSYVNMRWADRFYAMRDRWASVLDRTKPPPNFMDVLQVQVLVQSAGPLPPEAREQTEKFFLQAAELIRRKCAQSVAGSPPS
jgi:exosortase